MQNSSAHPKTARQNITAWTAGIMLTAAIAWLPRAELGATGDGGQLRLSLRRAAGVHESCRTLSADELKDVPIHMRQEKVCEAVVIPYKVRATSDGQTLLEREERPRGARGDRPMVIDEFVDLPTGKQTIAVTFAPVTDTAAPTTALVSHRATATVDVQPGDIIVAFLENEDQALRLIQP